MDFSNDEIARYSRQLLLPEVGRPGQERLRSASVLCVGAGGLGSPVAMYLAAAGVGRIGIVDSDRVEASNLHRQLLHGTPDIGRLKTESAAARLRTTNPSVSVEPHAVRLTAANAAELIARYDLVVDGSDNFAARFLVNDACVFAGKVNVYGAVFRFEGQASVLAPSRGGPCYRCLYPEPPPPGTAPPCSEAGVLGVVPGLVGCLQAAEALKLILGVGEPLIGRLLLVEVLGGRFRELRVRRDPDCPVCGDRPRVTRLEDVADVCGGPEAGSADSARNEVSVQELSRALAEPDSSVVVLDVREPAEAAVAAIAGAQLLPLSEIAEWSGRLAPGGRYYLFCKSGRRSRQAVDFLRLRGFQFVKSVRGGILAWAQEIDSRVPMY